ncbi:MAG: sodium:proton antiporter [Spirochaetales bacterium]|nr:sodium:proton antiporter [Spirochaetales bacterium]
MADILFAAAAGIGLLAFVISFFRIIAGPEFSDRIVALDAMTIISLSGIVFLTHALERIIYLDIALVYGLVSFLGVIAAARYMERGL